MSWKKGRNLCKLKLGSARGSSGLGAGAMNRDCERSGGSRLLAQARTVPVQVHPNNSLKLTSAVRARHAHSWHDGCGAAVNKVVPAVTRLL
jgi:hypothetical protein